MGHCPTCPSRRAAHTKLHTIYMKIFRYNKNYKHGLDIFSYLHPIHTSPLHGVPFFKTVYDFYDIKKKSQWTDTLLILKAHPRYAVYTSRLQGAFFFLRDTLHHRDVPPSRHRHPCRTIAAQKRSPDWIIRLQPSIQKRDRQPHRQVSPRGRLSQPAGACPGVLDNENTTRTHYGTAGNECTKRPPLSGRALFIDGVGYSVSSGPRRDPHTRSMDRRDL